MLESRRGLDAAVRARADLTIQQQVWSRILPEWKTILIYVSLPEEAATTPLILRLIEQGKQVCVPVFDRSQKCYHPSHLKDFAVDLEPGWSGIMEPKPSARRPVAPTELDAIFLPGLAFDRRGNRLGHGRGYFDALCRGTQAVKIALAYQLQIVDRIEATPRDVPVHMIITENGVIECVKADSRST